MVLFVAAIVDSYYGLRRLAAQGTLPSVEHILSEFSERWGYGLLLGALGMASWFSYRKYNKWAGLEPEDEE